MTAQTTKSKFLSLTSDMVITISRLGLPDILIPVADHYTSPMGKYEIRARFDPLGRTGVTATPATLDLQMTLGQGGHPGVVSIIETDWKKLKTKEWKYKRKSHHN